MPPSAELARRGIERRASAPSGWSILNGGALPAVDPALAPPPASGPTSLVARGARSRRLSALADAGLKRAEDLLFGAVALALFAPLMALIALAIRLDSPGRALFLQERRGLNGRVIRVYKFRTMRADADPAFRQAERDDPRVTRFGAFLRRTSLDELPQLFNVLDGSMSVVGPRPHPIALDEEFARLIPGLASRYAVKPGITGWAQINGYRGETRRLEDMVGRVAHDRYYVRHRSLALDLKILVLTLLRGWTHENAY